MHKLSKFLITQLRRMAMALLGAIATVGNLQGAVLTDLRIVAYTGQRRRPDRWLVLAPTAEHAACRVD